MSPRHQTSSGSCRPRSASAASSAGRLLWTSDMTATRKGSDEGHGPPLWAARAAGERELLKDGIRYAAPVREGPVEQEVGAAAQDRRIDVADPPLPALDAPVAHGRV